MSLKEDLRRINMYHGCMCQHQWGEFAKRVLEFWSVRQKQGSQNLNPSNFDEKEFGQEPLDLPIASWYDEECIILLGNIMSQIYDQGIARGRIKAARTLERLIQEDHR